jgi:hypothetical protein
MKNGLFIDKNGVKNYYLNDELHNEEGPAVECPDGSKYYFINGEYHRDGNLPAIEYPNGSKYYYINGQCHRENGPACEYASGTKEYYLNGLQYTEEKYWKEIKKRKSLNFILSNIKEKISK